MTETKTAPQAAPAPTDAKPVIANAEKHAKFVKLAETRVTKALNQIATLRGLTNKNNYEYTQPEVAAILSALRAEVDTLESAFKGKGPSKSGFTLAA